MIRYILLSWLLLATTVVYAQKGYKGAVLMTPATVEQKGDSLCIDVLFDFSKVKVSSEQAIRFIPTLTSANSSTELPAIEVKGHINYLTSKRKLALMNKTVRDVYEADSNYATIKGFKSNEAKTVPYSITIPYSPWMKSAKLDIVEDVCGCGKTAHSQTTSLVSNVKMESLPLLACIRPEVEVRKQREITKEVFLDFVVSQIDIRPDYMNNPTELKKITDIVTELNEDKNVEIKSINIVGYASPEGTARFNQTLSEGRTNALADYLKHRFSYPENIYQMTYGGENWDGLLQKVEQSDMKYKDEVLQIFQTTPIQDIKVNRKKALMDLRGGRPYKYMVEQFCPSLRVSRCSFNYEVKPFNTDQAKEVYMTNPKNLSLEELYQVANTYPVMSEKYVEVFHKAATLFPADDTANINGAIVALGTEDVATAQNYLNRVKQTDSDKYREVKAVIDILKKR